MVEIDPFTIKEVDLLDYQKEIYRRIYNVVTWLFSGEYHYIPFKGFLLYGPPGTGKSEIVRQVSKKIAEGYTNVKILFVDGADIASPKWGEAEKKLQSVFQISDYERKIIIFDDIESLMMSRGTDIAKEWHYSINSVLFHSLDLLDPSKEVILSTTNRIDLVDEALKSRLYLIKIENVPKEELKKLLYNTIERTDIPDTIKNKIASKIEKEIDSAKIKDIRGVMQEITVLLFNYISEGEI